MVHSIRMLPQEQESHQASRAVAFNWTQLSLRELAMAQGWYMSKSLCSSHCDENHLCPAHYRDPEECFHTKGWDNMALSKMNNP